MFRKLLNLPKKQSDVAAIQVDSQKTWKE